MRIAASGACLLASVVVSLAAHNCIADELEQKTFETVGTDLTPDFGSVVRGTSLIGNRLHDEDGTTVGTIKDVLIDPYCAQAASVVVAPNSRVERNRRLLVPLHLLVPLKEKLSASIPLADIEATAGSITDSGSEPFTRRMSTATFKHYGIKPYWTARELKTVDLNDRFIKLTDLQSKSVKSPSNEQLGSIQDVILSKRDGRALYTLFAHQHQDDESRSEASERIFAIPLAGYVVPTGTDKWQLELPETLLDNTQWTVGDKLPTELWRGWVEYIHVRYGRGVFDGAQRKPHVEK